MYQEFNKNYEQIKNCVLYIRVSTNRQVVEGHSFGDQKKRLTQYAKDKQWRILDIYSDGGKSGGSSAGRPEFQRMLERCAEDPSVHAVLLEETDRFARNTQDHLAVKAFLKKHQVELITTQQPNFGDDPVGTFVDTILASANQLQREITGVKTKRTMQSLAERGFQPGQAVLGYLNSYQKEVPWPVDPDNAHHIQEMFRLFNTGTYSIDQLEEEMYHRGMRSRTGKKVGRSAIGLNPQI